MKGSHLKCLHNTLFNFILTSGCGSAFLRQYSGMQGVPELEGMQQTEAPLDEIEVKTVIELFGIKVRVV